VKKRKKDGRKKTKMSGEKKSIKTEKT